LQASHVYARRWFKVNDFSAKDLDLDDEYTLFLSIISAQSKRGIYKVT
jgi:hypothetical protein